MIHSNNHNTTHGFTLIEVMLALFMLGTILTAIMNLETSTMNSVRRFSTRLLQCIQLSNLLTSAHFDLAQGKQAEKKNYQEERSSLEYEQKKLNSNSALKDFDSVVIEQLQAQEKPLGPSTRKETLISFLFKPEKEES